MSPIAARRVMEELVQVSREMTAVEQSGSRN